MLLYVFLVAFVATASAQSKMTDGTIACDPALRPVVINETGTTITTPNYPGEYPPDSTCEYLIEAPEGNGIQVVFNERFSVQECGFNCSCDRVEVYGVRADSSQVLLDTVCGERAVPFVQNGGERLLLVFISDSNSNGDVGFTAQVTFTDNPACSTGAILTELSGVITSPGYPGSYPNGGECRWIMFPPSPSYVTELTFQAFSIEDSCTASGIIYDYVDFNSVLDGETNRLARWEGNFNGISGATFSSRGGDTYTELTFTKDSSVSGVGFNITYQLVDSA